MNKSILFTGGQGTGKTTKIKTLLSCLNQKKVAEMTFNAFSQGLNERFNEFDFIAIDEVLTADDVAFLSIIADSHFNFTLIIGTQRTVKELEGVGLPDFHVVELGDI